MVEIGTWKIVLIFTISKEKMIRAINIRNKILFSCTGVTSEREMILSRLPEDPEKCLVPGIC